MAPSLFKLGAAALAYSTSVAAVQTYQLSESYDYTNFFDKFNFFESNYNTGDYNDVDPTSGFVNYRNQADAESLGLIATQGTEMYIGVDHANTFTPGGVGRNSVRVESKSAYTYGLFIGKFTHLPTPVCGAWPAFWMYGPDWPANGEIDIYEMWNLAAANQITLHTDGSDEIGSCKLNSALNTNILTSDCAYNSPTQYDNQGCGVSEVNGQWGSSSGGVYATEWQADHISVWSWPNGAEPADVQNGKPDPSTWGTPHMKLASDSCNLPKAFSEMSIVLNIDFCGVASQTGIWDSCGLSTGYSCEAYVGANPNLFNDVFWKIAYLKVYQLGNPVTSSSTTASSTTSTSSSTTSSSTTTTSATSSSVVSSTETSSSTIVSSTSSVVSSTETSSSTIVSSTSSVVSSTESSSSIASSTSSAVSSSETSSSTLVVSSTDSSSSTITSVSVSSSATSSTVSTSTDDTCDDDTTTTSATSSVYYNSTTVASTTTTSVPYYNSTITSISSTTSSVPYSNTTATSTTTDDTCDEESTTTTVTSATSVPYSNSTITSVTSTTSVPYSNTTMTSSTSTDDSCDEESTTTTATSTSLSGSASSTVATSTSTTVGGSGSSTVVTSTATSGSSATLPTSGSSSDEYTTSTIFSTTTRTITSCAATVTDCPARSTIVTTEIIAISTTVCPVTATETPKPTGSDESGWTTSTVYSTTTYTITSCKPEVTDCPGKLGQVTTEVIAVSTTVCPVTEANTKPVTFVTKTAVVELTSTKHLPSSAPLVVVEYTATVVPTVVSKPSSGSSSAYGSSNSTVSSAKPAGTSVVTVSGGVRVGASVALVVVGAFFAFAL